MRATSPTFALSVLLMLPAVSVADDYTPLDYSDAPTSEKAAPSQDSKKVSSPASSSTKILGPDDFGPRGPKERHDGPPPEKAAEPDRPVQRTFPEIAPAVRPVEKPKISWDPEVIQPEPPRGELVERYTRSGKSQVLVLTGCGWGQRDRHGRFNSSCLYCNTGNTAIDLCVRQQRGHYTAGESESDDFWIINIDSPEGHQINLAMGQNGNTLTELVGMNDPAIRAPKSVTPVFVVRHPDKPVQVVPGWPPNLTPGTAAADWWLLGLVGESKSDPRTWRGLAGDPAESAVEMWAKSGPNETYGGWGATVPARQLIEWFAPNGRREIAGGAATVVVPLDFRPIISSSSSGARIDFQGAPYLEYQLGFLPGKAVLSHITVSQDFRLVTLYARGYRTTFPIRVDWEE